MMHLSITQCTYFGISAWWGFALAADRQRIERFILHAVRMGYNLPPEQRDAESLVTEAENCLLTSVNHRHYHVGLLRPLFPSVITRRPGLRPARMTFH